MGAPFQGRCPASEVNDGGCPGKPDHLSSACSGGCLADVTVAVDGAGIRLNWLVRALGCVGAASGISATLSRAVISLFPGSKPCSLRGAKVIRRNCSARSCPTVQRWPQWLTQPPAQGCSGFTAMQPTSTHLGPNGMAPSPTRMSFLVARYPLRAAVEPRKLGAREATGAMPPDTITALDERTA